MGFSFLKYRKAHAHALVQHGNGIVIGSPQHSELLIL